MAVSNETQPVRTIQNHRLNKHRIQNIYRDQTLTPSATINSNFYCSRQTSANTSSHKMNVKRVRIKTSSTDRISTQTRTVDIDIMKSARASTAPKGFRPSYIFKKNTKFTKPLSGRKSIEPVPRLETPKLPKTPNNLRTITFDELFTENRQEPNIESDSTIETFNRNTSTFLTETNLLKHDMSLSKLSLEDDKQATAKKDRKDTVDTKSVAFSSQLDTKATNSYLMDSFKKQPTSSAKSHLVQELLQSIPTPVWFKSENKQTLIQVEKQAQININMSEQEFLSLLKQYRETKDPKLFFEKLNSEDEKLNNENDEKVQLRLPKQSNIFFTGAPQITRPRNKSCNPRFDLRATEKSVNERQKPLFFVNYINNKYQMKKFREIVN